VAAIVQGIRKGEPLYAFHKDPRPGKLDNLDDRPAKNTVYKVKDLYLAGALGVFMSAYEASGREVQEPTPPGRAEELPEWDRRFRAFAVQLKEQEWQSAWTVRGLEAFGVSAEAAVDLVRRFDQACSPDGEILPRRRGDFAKLLLILWLNIEAPEVPVAVRDALAHYFYVARVFDLSEAGLYAALALRYEPWRGGSHQEAFEAATERRWPKSSPIRRKRGLLARLRDRLTNAQQEDQE
jgi:hypothetical protein